MLMCSCIVCQHETAQKSHNVLQAHKQTFQHQTYLQTLQQTQRYNFMLHY
jgi:hypothetical protein